MGSSTEYRRAYYLKNKEKEIAKSKEWKKKNPDKLKKNRDSYFKSPKGVLSKIFDDQRTRRGVGYTRDEFYDWADKNPDYWNVYKKWVENDYNHNLKPSVDRIDSKLGYTIDNIQILTWRNNRLKQYLDVIDNPTRRNKTGVTGVSVSRGRYVARIMRDGKDYHLGSFLTLEEAATARKDAEKIFFLDIAATV